MKSIIIFTVVTFLSNICYGQINLDKTCIDTPW